MSGAGVLANAVRAEPTKANRDAAVKITRALRSRQRSFTLLISDGTAVRLPRSLALVLRAAAEALVDGRAITLLSSDVLLSPAEAAELLGLKRAFVVRLLEQGEVPSERVPGSPDRGVLLADLLAFQARRDHRRVGRERLAAAVEETGLPY